MPKVTFHNLPEEKKQKLIQAILAEFSRVPLFQASISNIIKEAKIPRGSFYQYFDDKEDAYFYLLNKLIFEVRDKFLSILAKNDGYLFDTMSEFFQTMIEEDANFHFLKNSLLNMNHKIEDSLSGVFSSNESMEQFQKLYAQVNKSKLNIINDDDLFYLMKIITAVTFHNLIERFSKDISNEEAVVNYNKQMKMLKKGLAKD